MSDPFDGREIELMTRLILDLPPDIAEALHHLGDKTRQDRETLALVLLRDALIANGMLEDGDLDEETETAGTA